MHARTFYTSHVGSGNPHSRGSARRLSHSPEVPPPVTGIANLETQGPRVPSCLATVWEGEAQHWEEPGEGGASPVSQGCDHQPPAVAQVLVTIDELGIHSANV